MAKLTSMELPAYGRDSGGSYVVLLVSDTDGLADDVRVESAGSVDVPSASFTVTDPAGMRPSAGCVAIDAWTVSCTSVTQQVPSQAVQLDLGGGNDREVVAAPPQVTLIVNGGEGDDILPGVAARAGAKAISTASFSVWGGPGRDTITGYGRDSFIDGGPGSDRIDAGEQARLSYASSPQGVRVDLAAGSGGATGELDELTGHFDQILGSPYGDDLRGTDAGESLDGGDGNDTIYARSGDDQLEGGHGNDLLVGGAGNDRLRMGSDTRTFERDRAEGGPGDDTIEAGRGADTLLGGAGSDTFIGVGVEDIVEARDDTLDRVSCTRPRPGAAPRPPRIIRVDTEDSVVEDCTGTRRSGPAAGVIQDVSDATVAGTRITVGLACSVDAAARCPMRLTATADGLGVIARRNVVVPRAGYRRVALTLSPTARTALRCTGKLRVRVNLATRDSAHRPRNRTIAITARAGVRSDASCSAPRDGSNRSR